MKIKMKLARASQAAFSYSSQGHAVSSRKQSFDFPIGLA